MFAIGRQGARTRSVESLSIAVDLLGSRECRRGRHRRIDPLLDFSCSLHSRIRFDDECRGVRYFRSKKGSTGVDQEVEPNTVVSGEFQWCGQRVGRRFENRDAKQGVG